MLVEIISVKDGKRSLMEKRYADVLVLTGRVLYPQQVLEMEFQPQPVKRGRGRPPGAKNKPKVKVEA